MPSGDFYKEYYCCYLGWFPGDRSFLYCFLLQLQDESGNFLERPCSYRIQKNCLLFAVFAFKI